MPPHTFIKRSFLLILLILISQLPLAQHSSSSGQGECEPDLELLDVVDDTGMSTGSVPSLPGVSRGDTAEEHIHGDWSINVTEAREDLTIYLYDNITIERTGSLTIRNCVIYFMDTGFVKTITLLKHGSLMLDNVDMDIANSSTLNKTEKKESGYFIFSRGVLEIKNSRITNYRELSIIESDSVLSDLELTNSLTNGLYFKSSNSTLSSVRVNDPGHSGIYALFSELSIEGVEVSGANFTGILLRQSNLSLAPPVHISSNLPALDLDLGSIIRTEMVSVKQMDYAVRDRASMIIISGPSGDEVLTMNVKEDVPESNSVDVVMLLGMIGVLVLLALAWIKREVFLGKSRTKAVEYRGEGLESFSQDGARRASQQQKIKDSVAEAKDPKSPTERKDILFEFGKMAMNGGEHNKAISYFRKLVSQCDDEQESYRYLIKVYEKAKNDPETLKYYRKLLAPVVSRKGKQKTVLFEFGMTALQNGDYDTARTQFESALSLCDTGEQKNSYYKEIYAGVKNDTRLLSKYRTLLAPFMAEMRKEGRDSSLELGDLESSGSSNIGSAFRRAMKK